ncbi:MAG: hypothetical protein HQ574_07410 [Chloroflexi bacterium]|nr:hypothetical protein [Chloroflexota bacterium]
MMKIRFRIITTILLFLSSCSLFSPVDLVTRQEYFPAAEISTVQLFIGKGELEITRTNGFEIQVTSSTGTGFSPAITDTGSTLVLDFEDTTAGDSLSIQLPDGLLLEIQSYAADIRLIDLSGQLTVRNTAGDIILEGFQGETSLWAGRGDIAITGGTGKTVLIGEHGKLLVEGFSGPVSMTTIMGQIGFQGPENSSEPIQLEADHGSITASLPEISDHQIEINSAGGIIVCAGGNLERTINGCVGSTGSGLGKFKIRTVSGRIEFRILPGLYEENRD